MNIEQEIKFLKKLRREYINRPDNLPKHVINDLIDLNVRVVSDKTMEYDKHFINQIDNQIHVLKSKLK